MDSTINNDSVQSQELLIRIERNGNIIERLYKQINSYTCVPNNSDCFEKLYDLKHSFRDYVSEQQKIILQLKSTVGDVKNLDSKILPHIKKFRKLESEMAKYLLDSNQYI